ncbi:hypothetical protein RLIN73S_01438 [Rhodanobacter lindaniclasticus]
MGLRRGRKAGLGNRARQHRHRGAIGIERYDDRLGLQVDFRACDTRYPAQSFLIVTLHVGQVMFAACSTAVVGAAA